MDWDKQNVHFWVLHLGLVYYVVSQKLQVIVNPHFFILLLSVPEGKPQKMCIFSGLATKRGRGGVRT